MYDIEVDGEESYAVIHEGSPAYGFLRAMNSQLVMKKLASEGGEVFLTTQEVIPLCQGFRVDDLRRLQQVGLIQIRRSMDFSIAIPRTMRWVHLYTFTDYGLEVMAHLRSHGGDVEILL